MISFLVAMDIGFLLLPFTTFILVFFVFRLGRKLKSSYSGGNTKIKLPPGPWKLPIIGSLHHLAGGLMPHHALRDLSKRHGPIMHLQLGEISAVVVSSPKMGYEVLKTHDINFANRPEFLAAKIITYGFQDIGFAPYGPYWRQMRKICTLELLSAKCIRSFSSIREDECLKLVESIRTSLGSPINITKKIFSLTNDVVCRAVFGNKCKLKDALNALISESASVSGGFDVSDVFPSLTLLHVLMGTKSRLVSLHNKIDKILENIISEHEEDRKNQQSRSGKKDEDLLDVLLRHQKYGDLECSITKDNIKATLLDVLGGGIDTSSSVVEWTMVELMKNRRVMEKIQEELRQAFKGRKIIRGTDINGLDYLKLIVKEALRLHPPVPLLLPRENVEQCEIDGYLIPAKTKVIVNAWAIGRDPDHWKDEPESFIPERFDESSINFLGSDFQYIPFGAGRRICPGMSFGLANLEFSLAQLLYHFNWDLPVGMKPEDLDLTDSFGAVVRRKTDLLLVATPYTTVSFDD